MNQPREMPQREVSLEELYRYLDADPGVRSGERVKIPAAAQDPISPLTKPLAQYDDRIFFYAGLLYAFCRIDPVLTERFREAAGRSAVTHAYLTAEPLITHPTEPKFQTTRVSRLLQSVATPDHQDLFDFVMSQRIVDRTRGLVWQVGMETVTVPDPYMVGNKDMPQAVQLVMFYPYTWSTKWLPIGRSGMLPKTPEISRVTHLDPALKQATEQALAT